MTTPENTGSKRHHELSPKKHLSRKALIARLAGALFVLSNLGMAVKYHVDFDVPNTPAGILRDIKGIPTEWQYTLENWRQGKDINARLNQSAPSTFESKITDEQLIQAGKNANPVSSDDLPTFLVGSQGVQENSLPQVNIAFPGKLVDGDRVLISTKIVDQGFNPTTQKIEQIRGGTDVIFSRKGTEIIVQTEKAEVFRLDPLEIDGKPYFRGVIVRFTGADDILYEMYITAPEDVRDFEPTDAISKAPTRKVSTKIEEVNTGERGLILNGGTSILKTSSSNAHLSFTLRGFSPSYNKFLPSSINFLTRDGKLTYIPQE